MKRKIKKVLASILSVFLVATIMFSSYGSITAQAWKTGEYNFIGKYKVSEDSTHSIITQNVLDIIKSKGYKPFDSFSDDVIKEMEEMLLYGVNHPNVRDTASLLDMYVVVSRFLDVVLDILALCPTPAQGVLAIVSFYTGLVNSMLALIREAGAKADNAKLTVEIDGRFYVLSNSELKKIIKQFILDLLSSNLDAILEELLISLTAKPEVAIDSILKVLRCAPAKKLMVNFHAAIRAPRDVLRRINYIFEVFDPRIDLIAKISVNKKYLVGLSKSVSECLSYLSVGYDTWQCGKSFVETTAWFLKKAEHYYNPSLKGSFLSPEFRGKFNAKVAFDREYNLAIKKWRSNNVYEAMFHLGCALHYLQDVCVPFHSGLIPDFEEIQIFGEANLLTTVFLPFATPTLTTLSLLGTKHSNFELKTVKYVINNTDEWKCTSEDFSFDNRRGASYSIKYEDHLIENAASSAYRFLYDYYFNEVLDVNYKSEMKQDVAISTLRNAQLYSAVTLICFSEDVTISKDLRELYNYVAEGDSSGGGSIDFSPTPVEGTTFYKSNFSDPAKEPIYSLSSQQFTMTGVITSNKTITSVTAGISGKVNRSVTDSNNSTSYNIAQRYGNKLSLNERLKFNNLPIGSYTYYVKATTSDGTQTVFDSDFTVTKAPFTVDFSGVAVPDDVMESEVQDFKLQGAVSVKYYYPDYKLNKVTVGLYKTSGAIATDQNDNKLYKEYKYDSGVKSVNIADADSIVDIKKLKVTDSEKFVYKVTAYSEDAGETKEKSKTFIVENTQPDPVKAADITLKYVADDNSTLTQVKGDNGNVFEVYEAGTLNVSWKASKNGKTYKIHVLKGDKEVATVSTTNLSANIRIPKSCDNYDETYGDYKVYIDATNAKGNKTTSGENEKVDFTLKVPEVQVKVEVKPGNAASYTVFTVTGKYATDYTFELYELDKKGNREKLYCSEYVQTTETNFKTTYRYVIGAGEYEVVAKAVNNRWGEDKVFEGKKKDSEVVRFKVTMPKPEKVPLGVKYKDQEGEYQEGNGNVFYQTSSLLGYDGYVVFHWEPAAFVYDSYVVTVYDVNGKEVRKESVGDDFFELKMKLKKGKYTAILTMYNGDPKNPDTLSNSSDKISFEIQELKYDSIRVDASGLWKTEYAINEVFNPTGLKVYLVYNNGKSEIKKFVPNALCSFSKLDSSTPGTKTMTVTFNGLSAKFTVNVTTEFEFDVSVTYNNTLTLGDFDKDFWKTIKEKFGEEATNKIYSSFYKDAFRYMDDGVATITVDLKHFDNVENCNIEVYKGSAINDYDEKTTNAVLEKSEIFDFDNISGDKLLLTVEDLSAGRYVVKVTCKGKYSDENGEQKDKEITKYINFYVLKVPEYDEETKKIGNTDTIFLEYLDAPNGVTVQTLQKSGGELLYLQNGSLRINWTKLNNRVCIVSLYKDNDGEAKEDELVFRDISVNDYMDSMNPSLNLEGILNGDWGLLNYENIVGCKEEFLESGSYYIVLETYKITKDIDEYVLNGKYIPDESNCLSSNKKDPFRFYIETPDVEKLVITSNPLKMNYAYGSKFELEGLEIKCTYTSGETVTLDNRNITVVGYNRYKAGTQNIMFSYFGETVVLEGVTVDPPKAGMVYPSVIQVNSDGSLWTKDVTKFTAYADKDIRISWNPVENENGYIVYIFNGDTVDLENFKNLEKTIDFKDIKTMDDDGVKRYYTDVHLYAGNYTVCVAATNNADGRYTTYSDGNLSFKIEGNSEIEFIYADYLSSKTFAVNEGLSLNSIVVYAYLKNGDVMDITEDCEYFGFDTSTATGKDESRDMTIVYKGVYNGTERVYGATLVYAVNGDISEDKHAVYTNLSDLSNLNIDEDIKIVTIADGVTSVKVSKPENGYLPKFPNVVLLHIPETVTEFDESVIKAFPYATIVCKPGSVAHEAALKFNVPYILVSKDDTATDDLYTYDKYIEDNTPTIPDECDPEGLLVWFESTVLYPNDTSKAYYDVYPYYSNTKEVKWESSDDSIISIDENGVVTANGIGTATITMWIEGFENIRETITFTVLSTIAEVEDGTIFVEKYQFYGNTGIKEIRLPNSVLGIDEKAFAGCTGLTEVVLNDGIYYIGAYAFADCTNLTKLVLPEGIESIYEGLVDGCTNLKTVFIPESVIEIDPYVFDGIENLEILCYEGSYAHYYAQALGINYRTKVRFADDLKHITADMIDTSVYAVFIPDLVVEIDAGVFDGIDDLVIECYSGSYAEQFAKEAGIEYIAYETITDEEVNENDNVVVEDATDRIKLTALTDLLINFFNALMRVFSRLFSFA